MTIMNAKELKRIDTRTKNDLIEYAIIIRLFITFSATSQQVIGTLSLGRKKLPLLILLLVAVWRKSRDGDESI